MKKTIATFGEILVEIMASEKNQSFLKKGIFTGPYPSGAPAIFINQVALFGERAKMYSVVGDDDFGQLNIDRLKKNGVDTKYIQLTKDMATGVAFVRYNSDGSRKFIYHIENAACGLMEYKKIPNSFFQDISYLHIMGSSIYNKNLITIAEKSVNQVKANGGKISFDPNIRPEILRNNTDLLQALKKIVKQCDVYFTGEDESNWLFKHETPSESEVITYLQKQCIEYIIVKRAERGASLYYNGTRYNQGAIVTQCIDPTGAGDSFAASFIASLNKGISPDRALQYANIVGAAVVSKQGPMEGAITFSDVEKNMYK